MKITQYQSREAWLEGRTGKITGSSLKDIVTLRGNGKKAGYWKLLADRLATQPDGEPAMDRGNRLEEEAIERFTEQTGKEVTTDLVIWERDDNSNIALSPDGYIENNGKVTEAVEVKCLASEKHIEAIVTKSIPKDYEFQVLQYFITNDDLEMLHFVMYDPRFIEKLQFKMFTIMRDELSEKIETYLTYERDTLKEIDDLVEQLTF